MLIDQELTRQIIGAAIEVHRHLGPGLLESVYEACLVHELAERGLVVDRQVELPVRYKNVSIDCDYRVDLIINDQVVVELKAVETVHPIHEAQLMTYLRLSGKKVGLLINFNVRLLRDGITRRVM